jgi:prepilin-type N-terminal cleavage/methylation domain-containing protein
MPLSRKAFTLIELLVVIAIITVLIAVLVPTLVRVRNQARGVVCLQNLRTLSLSWLTYKDDNGDNLVGGHVGKHTYDWVQGPTGEASPVECEKEGIRRGSLFIYAGNNVNAYRCPADERKLTLDQVAFRSYSIAGGANGEVWQNSYLQVKKYSEITGPAGKYIFVEESDPRGWNMGSWVMNPKTKAWVDPLAVWHGGAGSTLGFADGHAVVRTWVDDSTIEMSQNQEFFHPIPADEGEDLIFMAGGFPCRTPENP